MKGACSASARPAEFAGRADDYIALVTDEMMPQVAARGLADAVDCFLETIGFTVAETERVFARARDLGLPVKLHAEQLSDQGGAALLARFGGLSADHLEYVSEDGVRALADAGSVAVLLPGAFYFLREAQAPPIDLFRRLGVPIALATDSNPGSSPVLSLLLMLNMACTLFRLTPEEALALMAVGQQSLHHVRAHTTNANHSYLHTVTKITPCRSVPQVYRLKNNHICVT